LAMRTVSQTQEAAYTAPTNVNRITMGHFTIFSPGNAR
jgi:hypothetical protein